MDSLCDKNSVRSQRRTPFNPLWKNFSTLRRKSTTQSPLQSAKVRNSQLLRLNSTGETDRSSSKPWHWKKSSSPVVAAIGGKPLASAPNITGRSLSTATVSLGGVQQGSSIASDILQYISSPSTKSSSLNMSDVQSNTGSCMNCSQPQSKKPRSEGHSLCESSCAFLKGFVSPGTNSSHKKRPDSSHFHTASVKMHSQISQPLCPNKSTSYRNAVAAPPKPPVSEHEEVPGEILQKILSNLTLSAPCPDTHSKAQKNSVKSCRQQTAGCVKDPCKGQAVKEPPAQCAGSKKVAAVFEEGPHFTKLEHEAKTFPIYEKPLCDKPKKSKKKKKPKFNDLMKAYGHVDIQETTGEDGKSEFVVHGVFSVDGCGLDSSDGQLSDATCDTPCAKCSSLTCKCLHAADISVTGSLDESTGTFVVTVSDKQESPAKEECNNSAIQFILGGGSSSTSGADWDEEIDWSDCDDEVDADMQQALLNEFAAPSMSFSITTDFRKCHSDPSLSPRKRNTTETSESSDDLALFGEFSFADALLLDDLPSVVTEETVKSEDEEEELLDRPRTVRFDPEVVVHHLEPEDRTNTLMLDKQRFKARIERAGSELASVLSPAHREQVFESRFSSGVSEPQE